MRMLALIISILLLGGSAQAAEGRCQAIKSFLSMYEAAEENHLGGPLNDLALKPLDEANFARFAAAYSGDYTKTVLGGIESLKVAYPDVAAIDASIAQYVSIRDKMLAMMKAELSGGTGAWEAYEAATSYHEPLGEAFVMWFVPERDRCAANP